MKNPNDRILKALAGSYIANRLALKYAHIDYINTVDYDTCSFIADVNASMHNGTDLSFTAEFNYSKTSNGRFYIKSFKYC